MAQYSTRKGTSSGKASTLARRQARAVKAGATRVNRSGRISTTTTTTTSMGASK